MQVTMVHFLQPYGLFVESSFMFSFDIPKQTSNFIHILLNIAQSS
jgi:hypothetical protein